MKPLLIILLTFIGLSAWIIWLVSRPGGVTLMEGSAQEQLDAYLPPQPTEGNRITTFTDFGPFLNSLLADISTAEHHVHVQFFKFESDAVGQLIGNALAESADRGVEARLLYDDFVCHPWHRYYRHLNQQGVQCAGFGPVHFPLIRRRDYYRNHRKVVVVDGKVAYLGGMNVAERYLHGLSWGCWRDTMIRIEGPVVASLQHAFLADWHYATKELHASPKYFPAVPSVGSLPISIITSGPIGAGHSILDFTIELLGRSRQCAWFESPYFIPPKPLAEALKRSAQRGVDIRIILPPRGDRGETTQWASKYFFTEMMNAGIKFYLYNKGYMHSKIIVADNSTAVVSSCNIDPRSYFLCEEVAAVIDSPIYVKELKSIFLTDLENSSCLQPDIWSHRPTSHKIKESCAHLISSQL
ncbi:MAG: cardiolipin synthase [Bacteroidales bacterium]|nr:cardiolipin synthase [Bacteroidales bacterium]MBR3412223.1 cardiolipin synthase [Bacteroidales bacterium]